MFVKKIPFSRLWELGFCGPNPKGWYLRKCPKCPRKCLRKCPGKCPRKVPNKMPKVPNKMHRKVPKKVPRKMPRKCPTKCPRVPKPPPLGVGPIKQGPTQQV